MNYREWITGGNRGTKQSGERGKNWDNYNSIINKIYFLKKERIDTSLMNAYTREIIKSDRKN